MSSSVDISCSKVKKWCRCFFKLGTRNYSKSVAKQICTKCCILQCQRLGSKAIGRRKFTFCPSNTQCWWNLGGANRQVAPGMSLGVLESPLNVVPQKRKLHMENPNKNKHRKWSMQCSMFGPISRRWREMAIPYQNWNTQDSRHSPFTEQIQSRPVRSTNLFWNANFPERASNTRPFYSVILSMLTLNKPQWINQIS